MLPSRDMAILLGGKIIMARLNRSGDIIMDKLNMACYVCDKELDVTVDKTCYKMLEDGVRHRCLWHGAPGSWYVNGLQRYAINLLQAKAKAIKYLTGSSAPYAAPEVRAEEQDILNEVERLMAMPST